jgi:hypothetical protein
MRTLRAVIAASFSLALAAAAATPVEALAGRWNLALHWPQGSYETPVEFRVGSGGRVTATVLGPFGTFRLDGIAGSLDSGKLALAARTSWGRLKASATLDGDRLAGKWYPAGQPERGAEARRPYPAEAAPGRLFRRPHGLDRRGAGSIDQLDAAALPAFSGYDSAAFAREMAEQGALMLTTGGRAGRPYRGRIVLLIDEYCFSAAEALAGAARESGAATLVGRRTAGAMLAAVPVAIEGGWTLLLPVWDFRTPQGARIEGKGVEPHVAVKARGGRDADLAAAIELLRSPGRSP